MGKQIIVVFFRSELTSSIGSINLALKVHANVFTKRPDRSRCLPAW